MEENQGSVESGSVNSGDLSAAVAAVSSEAPKLSGLDKLKAQKEYVEKNDTVPPKAGEKQAPNAQKPAAATPKVAPAPGTPAVDPDAAATPYKPDFKYKAGGKEMEIPEKFRALMTDKASEEEVKKLFGQAATLDEFKQSNMTLKENLTKVGGELNNMQSGIQQLRTIAQKNDWDTWFAKLNIAPERIYNWVLDKVKYNQLPPEQRAQIDQQRELQRQAEIAQTQVGAASQRELTLATQMKGMQLDIALGKDDVKSMQDAFDSRAGKPGAFKEAIIQHGLAVWALSGQKVDLTPEQAIADFVQKYGNPSAYAKPNPAAEAAIPNANTPAPSGQSANSTPAVKVIPNVGSRSSISAVKQKPKSIEDLKRLRDEAVKADNASRSPSQGYLAG